ncbi:hypothetical protein COT98_04230 [Candidatus Falkowbacteria bacterium CG10_big_fil_rev_8_21_14_0_10_39_9]|uniref:Uncharacterized protein n=1 Tax=Candidatus Falkowbacteria bacterium CG10_big_fil_rev_8_21_14_0_10_39_9 TaxID=1974566 RepID=A0A2M6WNE3_9BACT|nr:MAG: hypothetical protein COT98_04230 [Candidatus Falkowbacteria bacterium CG10_big_fil_rev_8_21_14_0_10_39_9]PIU88982.1 MAG: hypothetical protein COS64_01885 [archaeon CG06_land_8_20_14_3_00_37_11]
MKDLSTLTRPRRKNKVSPSKKSPDSAADLKLDLDQYLNNNYDERLRVGFNLLNGGQIDEIKEYEF